jgi:hypothetical protein
LFIKNSKFDTDFESGEKVAKISTEKVINITVKNFFLSSFSAVVKSSMSYNILSVTFFLTFFEKFKISVKFCVFDTDMELL